MNDQNSSVQAPPQAEVEGASIAGEVQGVTTNSSANHYTPQNKRTAEQSVNFKINYVDFKNEDVSLHLFVTAVMSMLHQEQLVPLHRRLARQLRKKFDPKVYRTFADYMQSSNPGYLKRVPVQTLRKFLTCFYSACCEVVGPVATDRWFSQLLEELTQQQPHFDLAAMQRLL